ncbi:hypothetical protein [Dinoroseobacter sp. S124A]|uniref:hypothetical protein n=1 Tax=Dinoroseobacter sp. S124A TaxID=3415128 RepID=UPI003C7DE3D3
MSEEAAQAAFTPMRASPTEVGPLCKTLSRSGAVGRVDAGIYLSTLAEDLIFPIHADDAFLEADL